MWHVAIAVLWLFLLLLNTCWTFILNSLLFSRCLPFPIPIASRWFFVAVVIIVDFVFYIVIHAAPTAHIAFFDPFMAL